MKSNSTARRTTLGILAIASAAALLPAAAQAQQYDQRGGYYYDACRRDQTGRSLVGAVIGGLAGMALGNNIGDDSYRDRWGRVHDNDTGAAVGAVVGAGIGAGVGQSSAACAPQQQRYSNSYNYNYPQNYSYPQNYNYAPDYSYVAPPPPRYNDYYDNRYSQEPAYVPPPAYDEGYYQDRYSDRACRMVESRIRMPDGRTQTRMVQACPDSQGRYQLVD